MPDADRETWDLLVVGGGTAGIVASTTAAGFGARVLLVEAERTGGDCLWTGCVPSKALIAAATAAATARGSAHLGVRAEAVSVDVGAVMAHVRGAVEWIAPVDSPDMLRAKGVEVLTGRARLTGPGVADVDGRAIRFRQAVLAAGARPTLPPIDGLAHADPLTSDTVWDLDELPRRLLVIGGGTIGCELGQAMARLGSRVTLLEEGPRLLPAEDPDASAVVAAALRADGVDLRLGASAMAVSADAEDPRRGHVVLQDGGEIGYDRLLVATGRTPRTEDLGLAAVGVATDARGHVRVDEHLRTTNDRVWAAGDLTGHAQLTHVAGVHGSLAATNALLGVRRSVRPDAAVAPVRVTYARPEVAAVGIATDGSASGVRVLEQRHDHVDRALTDAETDGFTRLAVDRRGRVVGATVVGPRAGETIGEVALAVAQGLRTRDLAGVTHPYPTYDDGVWNAAIADVRAQLAAPVARRAVGALLAGRRRWLDRRER